MNVREALRAGARLLGSVSNEAELDAELLLRHVLHLARAGLYQHLDDPLTAEQDCVYRALLKRRLSREPTAYILGHREFFGLDFEVTPAAIIPRPDTETLVDLVLAFLHERFGASPVTIADVGTGAGVIVVSLARALPYAQVVAIDFSPDALALAGRNARRHGVHERIRFQQGDLLEPLDAPVDIVAANLPYVPTADWEQLPPELRDHEPRAGLDGGPDGLRVIDRLLRQAPAHLKPGGALFAEIGDEQGKAASQLARDSFPGAEIEIKPDLSGQDRVLLIKA